MNKNKTLNDTLPRSEYEKLPKPQDGMWLQEMQETADELKEMYTVGNEMDSDEMMIAIRKKALQSLDSIPHSSDLTFLSYTYWGCVEEVEKWDSVSCMEARRRRQVLHGWLEAIELRIEELGGKLEV